MGIFYPVYSSNSLIKIAMNLIITFDYEIFGDGSGDVFTHMIYPTQRILSICELHQIKTTIYFEVIEYLKMKQEWTSGNRMGYTENPIEAIENQLKTAALAGHDIQLHIHPQWVDAVYNGRWVLNMDNWRLGDFKGKQGYQLPELLKEGKEAIEALIQSVLPTYRCIALRAGGYNIMPSKEVYDAMLETGLKLDSSVYPGGFEQGALSRYDYREAPIGKDYWWAKPDDFTKHCSGSAVMEIPVFALQQSRINKFGIERIKSALLNKRSAMNAVKNKTEKMSFSGKVKYFMAKEAFTWDFCLFSMRLHKRFLKFIRKGLHQRQYFVLIGHPKNFTMEKSFECFVSMAKKGGAQFITLKGAYDHFIQAEL